jgi:hypothetical protein
VKKAMEVTLGRVLETRHWMKHLNDGVEYFSLDDLAKVRVFFFPSSGRERVTVCLLKQTV